MEKEKMIQELENIEIEVDLEVEELSFSYGEARIS